MSGVLDAGGLADCLIGLYDGRVGDEILDLYAEIRREKFLKFVDLRSLKNMNRIAKSDPSTVLDTDKFLGILRELEGDDEATKAFLLVCPRNMASSPKARLTGSRKHQASSTISPSTTISCVDHYVILGNRRGYLA